MHIPDPVQSHTPVLAGHSTRNIQPPSWMQDYIVNNACSSHTLHEYSTVHVKYLANLSQEHEPYSFKQAQNSDQRITAMNQEIQALEKNKTWEVVDLPLGVKPIGCKWVFRIKRKHDGTIDKYKARLVVKGYSQTEGIDYFDNFSPVAKPVTVRVLLALVAAKSWPLFQMDINNDFLYGFIDKKIYMRQPEGYHRGGKGQACKLTKSLYGLKQASRQWKKEFTTQISMILFNQVMITVFLCTEVFMTLVVYVDDILLTGNSEGHMVQVKQFLEDKFTIKELGNASIS
ncbi:transmembrane signal receptor [Lithospermum erythrorhizon]|uniref:Transmembrane signal receptor n=1 Tax=Lithospermum erythrorhizon TaxID=34254 RepID=A0AAV3P2D3_LITER